MNHSLLPIILAMLLTFPSLTHSRQLRDQVGNLIDLPDQPQRVIALAPALTEIVFALGQEARLVGTTRFSDYPAAATQLPRVGSYIRPDMERILALRPDLCLATKDGNPKEVVEKIITLGIPVFTINPRNLDEVIDAVRLLGDVLAAENQATRLTASMRASRDRVTAKINGATPRPKIFFQIDVSPIVSAGHATFIDELITLAGGTNLAAGPKLYPRFSWEELLVLAPEIVVITSMAGEQSEEDLIGRWQRYSSIPAVKNQAVMVVDANLFGRPTPRLFQGLEVLAAIFHPELFGGAHAE